MSHFLQHLRDEILSVQGQKDYCLDVLSAGSLQRWQSNEYSALVDQYDHKLQELNERLDAACL